MWTDSKGAVWDTGYHIKANDKFNYWAQIVNYNKQPAKIYVTFDTEWVPGLVGLVIFSLQEEATNKEI